MAALAKVGNAGMGMVYAQGDTEVPKAQPKRRVFSPYGAKERL
nr:hypothetical protein [uncultured Cohaesibacter sp.]